MDPTDRAIRGFYCIAIQLVVITHELIYGVRELSARGKIIVKQVYGGTC